MKTILALLFLVFLSLAVFGQAPPYQRQFFTTNLDPVVQATAGSNVFITYTLVGQTRTYRIDVPVTGTNVVTNLFITTNIFYINSNFFGTNIFLIATNTTYGQNIGLEQDGTTGGVYSVTIGNTNYFKMLVGGPAYGIAIYTNNDYLILSNLYPSIWWFTNNLGPTNPQTLYQYNAAGSISNNYNVAIRGLLQLYGFESNSAAGSVVPFNEFWVGGPNWSNTFMGRYAGVNSSNGLNGSGGNVFIGYRAGYSNTIGYGCVLIGSHAGQNQRTSPGNICIGEGVMRQYPVLENGGNTIVGWQACRELVNGFGGNTVIGKYAAQLTTSGGDNVGVGVSSLSIGTGDGNIALGASALQSPGNANYNIAIGKSAANGTLGSYNIIIGSSAGQNFGAKSNIIIGGMAMVNPALHESSNNIVIGSYAAHGMYTGSCNVIIGDSLSMMNYGVPAGYTLHSNIIIGLNHTPKMRWDPVDKWKFEDSLGVRYNLYPTQSVNIGYPSMLLWTNYFGTNTSENATPPATNIQFRLLVPSNLVIIATNGAGFTSNTTVYGTTGDALVNVPFRSASSSTSAPAGDEFVTKNYVLSQVGGGSVSNAISFVSSNGTLIASPPGATNLNFIGATVTSNAAGVDITIPAGVSGALTNNEARAVTFSNTFTLQRVDGSGFVTLNTNGSMQISNAWANMVPLRIDRWIAAQTTNLFEIASNGVMSFVVRSNGNVGINQSAPTEALMANGNIAVGNAQSFGFGTGATSGNAFIRGDQNSKYIQMTVNNSSGGTFLNYIGNFVVGKDSTNTVGDAPRLHVIGNPAGAAFAVNTNQLVVSNGNVYVSGPTYTTSSSTSAPASTEFVVAEWVRGLFAGGQLLYNTTNQQPYFTNADFWYSALPTTNTVQQARTYNSVTNGQYLGTGIASTNRYSQVNSPMTVNAYLSFNTGGGRAVTVHPELYYCYSEPGTNGPGNYTNLLGDYSAGGQALIAGTNLYTWVISFPTVVSTNANGFWVIRRFKVDSQANNPNVTIHGSGNTPSTIGFSNPGITTSGMVQFDQNSVVTNVLLNGSYQSNTCVTAYDISRPRQFYSTNDNLTFTDLSGVTTQNEEKESCFTLKNTKAGDIVLTIPNKWFTPDGLRAYTVTNGQVAEMAVKVWAGSATNAAVRMLR